jgi:phosphatidylglycerophosphate synthase
VSLAVSGTNGSTETGNAGGPADQRHRAADFFARHRGGGLFTETVNQRLASYLCVGSERLGLVPTALTLLNLLIGAATSISVVALAHSMADQRISSALVMLAALVGWQLAYSLDCADGQLARVTGRSSPAGGRVDILADVAQQILLIIAVTAVAVAYDPNLPTWLVSAFTGTWMVNLVTSVLQQGNASGSLISNSGLPIRILKLVRDYGAVITGLGCFLAVAPDHSVWLLAGFTLLNGGFLLASVADAARRSLG